VFEYNNAIFEIGFLNFKKDIMKYFLIILCSLLIPFQGISQCPPNTDLVFNSQAQLDQFINQYPNCHTINSLRVGPSNNWSTGIRDLSPLSKIFTVKNSVAINQCRRLQSLEGLNNLRNIGTFLAIFGNERLNHTGGIETLQVVNRISISRNIRLEAIIGFEKIKKLEHLSVVNCPSVTSLKGFMNLEVLGSLIIRETAVLTNLYDFNSLKSIHNFLGIDNNKKLGICHIEAVCNYVASPPGGLQIVNNSDNCKDQSTLQQACNSSFNNREDQSNKSVESLKDISLFPNPAFQEVNIHFGDRAIIDACALSIFDSFGRLIQQKPLQKIFVQTALDISDLDSGVYFLKFKTENRSVSRKLVIQK